MKFSYFDHFYSKIPQPSSCTDFDEFVCIMKIMSEQVGYKPSMGEYGKQHPLISPAIYNNGCKRTNDNVVGWDIIMMDIDDGIDDIKSIYDKFDGYNFLLYSSPNCTKDKLKLRVVVPLTNNASSDKLGQLWYACNEWCDGLVDKSTKDKARLYYTPARYTNKGDLYHHIFDYNKGGNDLDWEKLIEKYPSPPEEDRFKLKNNLTSLKRKIYIQTNKSPSTNILDDNCPFVYKKMIDDYRLTPIGGHHKSVYIFMLIVCGNAAKINYPLSIDELVDMATQVDELDGGFYDQKKLYDSAKNALEFTGVY